MRNKYTWKLGQWWRRQHVRLALCLIWLLGCMAASALGAFSPLDDAWRHLLLRVHATYASPPENVLMVALDEDYLEESGPSPYPLSNLIEALAVLTPHAPLVLVSTQAGSLWSGRADEQALCSQHRVLYHGSSRPVWLPKGCDFLEVPNKAPWFDAPLFSGKPHVDEALWIAVSQRLGTRLEHRPGHIAYSALPPVLAMQGLLETSEQGSLVGGRVVWIAPTAHRPRYALPSGLEATRDHVRAHDLAILLDDDVWVRTPRELVWLCAFLALGLAATMSQRRRLLAEYGAITVGWALFSAAMMLGVHNVLAPWMPVVVGWGGVALLRVVPPRMSDLRVDVRSRLLEVTRSVNADRAHLLTREQIFWQESLQRAYTLLEQVEHSMIAELPEGSWWIVPRAYVGMDESDIIERRRDIRREPYETPLQMRRGVVISRQFLRDEELDVILSPLMVGDRVLGFWMLATPKGQGRQVLNGQGTRIKQLSTQLAREIAWRRLEARQALRAATATGGVDLLIDESLLTLEQLSLQKQVLEQIVEGAQVGLMLVSLLGEVIFSNEIMSLHLGGELEEAMRQPGLEATISLVYPDAEQVSQIIRETLLGTSHTWERVLVASDDDPLGGRTFEFTLTPVQSKGAEQVESFLLTSHDVTQLTQRDVQRAAMLRLFNARSGGAAASIRGYVEVLEQSTSLSKAEKRVVERLADAARQLDRQIDDMLGVLEPEAARADRQIPVNLEFVLGTFLRQHSRRQKVFEVSWPGGEARSDLYIVRAQPDVLQQALRLLFEEFDAWRSEEMLVHITVKRHKNQTISLTLELPESTLPQSLLRELTDKGRQDQYSPSIKRARQMLESMEASLEIVQASRAGEEQGAVLRAQIVLVEVPGT